MFSNMISALFCMFSMWFSYGVVMISVWYPDRFSLFGVGFHEVFLCWSCRLAVGWIAPAASLEAGFTIAGAWVEAGWGLHWVDGVGVDASWGLRCGLLGRGGSLGSGLRFAASSGFTSGAVQVSAPASVRFEDKSVDSVRSKYKEPRAGRQHVEECP